GIGQVAGDRVDPLDHARAADESVLAQRHRHGAGMRVLAGNRDVVPAHALRALDDADGFALVFEDRALFDVQFEISRKLAGAGFFRTAIADALQFGAEGFAFAIGAAI